MNNKFLPVLAMLASATPSWAVFPFEVPSDYTTGWTGDGSPNTALDPTDTDPQIAVDNLTSGTFNAFAINQSDRADNGGFGIAGNLALGGGGTGDLVFTNSARNNFDGGEFLFNSVGVVTGSGVSSISLSLDFGQFVAARDDGNLSRLNQRPMIAALGLTNAGGFELNEFNVVMDFNNAFSDPTGSGEFVPGFGGGTPFQSGGWDPSAVGATTFVSTDGFDGTVNVGRASDNYLLVRGFDFDGGNFGDTDAPLAYASSQTWTITPGGDNTVFADGTSFVFSFDGEQFGNLDAVPEPSVFMLGAIGSLMFLSRRSRKSA